MLFRQPCLILIAVCLRSVPCFGATSATTAGTNLLFLTHSEDHSLIRDKPIGTRPLPALRKEISLTPLDPIVPIGSICAADAKVLIPFVSASPKPPQGTALCICEFSVA